MKKKLLGQSDKKRFFIKKCMEIYTDALIQSAQCFETRAKILSNRALLQMYLKNYRKAVEDCLEAIKLDPKFIRPYCRACECLLNLGMFEKCLKLADKGLSVDYMKEMKDIRDEALRKLEAENAKSKEKQIKAKEENWKLIDKCRELGIVLGNASDYPLPQVYNVGAADEAQTHPGGGRAALSDRLHLPRVRAVRLRREDGGRGDRLGRLLRDLRLGAALGREEVLPREEEHRVRPEGTRCSPSSTSPPR